jgi:glycosyltransferase involved in cell wall biosynthesis
MKISVVTPSYRRARYLDDTIRSVLTQRGDFEIEYVVQDGGSERDVLDLLQHWDERVKRGDFELGCRRVSFSYHIEPDAGMYDAITRGFARTSGELMCWLNTDDMYHPYAFQTVTESFNATDDIYWVTGIPNSYNARGSRVGFDRHPDAYARRYVNEGLYDVRFAAAGFNWIQQESTFWRRVLWDRAGGLDTRYRYAADFWLWRAFAEHADLVRVNSFLGGFRVHGDQITADPARYAGELPIDRRMPAGLVQLHRMLRDLPWTREKYLADTKAARRALGETFQLKREDLVGRVIEWSFDRQRWEVIWKLVL